MARYIKTIKIPISYNDNEDLFFTIEYVKKIGDVRHLYLNRTVYVAGDGVNLTAELLSNENYFSWLIGQDCYTEDTDDFRTTRFSKIIETGGWYIGMYEDINTLKDDFYESLERLRTIKIE